MKRYAPARGGLRSSRRPREACGIVGIFGEPEASRALYVGLHSLQHRGQESAGIATTTGDRTFIHRGMGLVSEVFDPAILDGLPGDRGIAHVRYSTAGSSSLRNAQPFTAQSRHGPLSIAHNGNLVNTSSLRARIEREGALFQSSVDSEIILHLMARSAAPHVEDQLTEALGQVEGAYSIAVLAGGKVIGARDPRGFRPLVLGRTARGPVVASESCALDMMGAEFVREVDPGEIVVLEEGGVRSLKPFLAARPAQCVFELIYFARPDSVISGVSVYEIRKGLGRELVRQSHVPADMVVPMPDSGTYAAIGYAQEAGIPFEMAVIRNHYVGRTFLQPTREQRSGLVRLKHNPIRSFLEGKRVVIVDDSIVRGTTSRERIRILRAIGVREVHMRISCPPHRYGCHYGIDFPSPGELIASTHSIEEIRSFLNLDSLAYLSVEGMFRAMPGGGERFCDACFTGDYPVPPEEGQGKWVIEPEVCEGRADGREPAERRSDRRVFAHRNRPRPERRGTHD
ncbi:MAG: amidophosphoribosyltransferase [Planctomycetes bacterium]|nr:amidophosphoribosyltransferase [Planctomycetota bacterium]